MREFLLKTSVLERMSAPVCEALTGHAGAQEMLERLERENLFVVPLDDERLWYRYHHLLPGIGDAAAGAMNTRPNSDTRKY